MVKITNLTKWLNNQNHARAMKIRPKTEKLNLTSYDRIFILDHEETILIRFRDVFHEIWLKISFCNPWWKSFSHGVWWKKKFEVWWKNAFVFWNGVRGLSFLLRKVFTLHKLRWDEKSWKLKQNPLFSQKSQVKLSPLGSSHSLQS